MKEEGMTRLRVVPRLVLVAALVLGAASLTLSAQRQAAAQQPSEADAIRATMQAAVNAWNQRDLGAFLTFWTAEALEENSASPRATSPSLASSSVIHRLRCVRSVTSRSAATTPPLKWS
jgi:hypothetical protein